MILDVLFIIIFIFNQHLNRENSLRIVIIQFSYKSKHTNQNTAQVAQFQHKMRDIKHVLPFPNTFISNVDYYDTFAVFRSAEHM